MSVVLDALRRRRTESTTGQSRRGVPAGLGLMSASSEVSRRHHRRFMLLAIALLVALVGMWLGIHVNSPGVVTIQSPSVQATGPSVAAASPTQDPTAAAVQGPAAVPKTGPRMPDPGPPMPDPGPRIADPRPRAAAGVDHFALALRYQNLGEFEQAREQYLAVLADNPSNAEARNNLGLLYHGRAMTNEAIDEFTRAIQINPRYIRARSNLGVVLTSAGRLAEARAQLRAALDVEPDNPDLLVNRALVEKADQHAEQAIEILLRAVAASPMHAAAHYNLAVLYEERSSLALAFDHYNAFLRHAGAERAGLLAQVQQRVRALEPRLHDATN